MCGEAENGKSAIEQALQLRSNLILLDLAMPEMTGAEAASVLKHGLPDIPIIIFTSHADDLGEDILQALNVERVASKFAGMHTLMESINPLLGFSNYKAAPTYRGFKSRRGSLGASKFARSRRRILQ